VPVLPIWDDHDFGDNDGGGDFAFKQEAERIFESFWGVEALDPRATRPGVYGSWSFGEIGERVQLVLLDTRFFRSELTPIPKRQWLKSGRYVPSSAADQDMLGPEQWEWLADTLKEPADLRIVVSSIQVLADDHGWERWGLLPTERARLLDLLHATPDVILVSGDRHWSSVYRDETGLTEMTTSAINRPSHKSFTETGPHQFTTPYVQPNFGEVQIDWVARAATVTTFDAKGVSVASVGVELGAGSQGKQR
jgi:alkaline phosphatase D